MKIEAYECCYSFQWESFGLHSISISNVHKRNRGVGGQRGRSGTREKQRKRGILHSKKTERIKRFSTQMQPTVLRLIKDTLFNIWPRKIYSTENLFQLQCVWRYQGNSWKIDEKWRKKGKNEKLLLCIQFFSWFFLRKRVSVMNWCGNIGIKFDEQNNSCNGVIFIIINFKDEEHPKMSTFRVPCFCSLLSTALAFLFCLSCSTL